MIYALMWLSLVMTMEAVGAIDAPLPLSLAEIPLLSLAQGKHHYHETGVESLPGLTGYTRNYYGPADTAPSDDLATYGNYAHKLLSAHHPHTDPHPHPHPVSSSPYPATANGFVPFYYSSQLHSQSPSHSLSQFAGEDEVTRRDPSANIDFVINAANYEPNSAGYEEPYEGFAYRPRVSSPTRPNHYHFEQISNYRNQDQRQEEQLDNSGVYARHKELQTLANPVKREQREESLSSQQQLAGRQESQEQRQYQQLEGRQQHHQQQPHQQQQHNQPQQQQHEQLNQQHVLQKPLGYIQDQRQQQRLGVAQDQQLLYSHTDSRVADLPAITTTVRHTPASSKAVAGLPLAKHIEVTKNVPITHYQKQHVPYKQTIQVQVPRTVIAAIPKPMPIKIPLAKTVAVPQLQEVKIPIERVKPVPVERPIPFVVERRVPYRVEKPVATPVYYPYPVKVPVVRTVVHKQRTHYVAPGWSATGNHLLG
nr:protein tweety [Drosophila kikkawai]